jgi:hypothetical protein
MQLRSLVIQRNKKRRYGQFVMAIGKPVKPTAWLNAAAR